MIFFLFFQKGRDLDLLLLASAGVDHLIDFEFLSISVARKASFSDFIHFDYILTFFLFLSIFGSHLIKQRLLLTFILLAFNPIFLNHLHVLH